MPVIKGHTLAAPSAAFVPGPGGRMSRLRGHSVAGSGAASDVLPSAAARRAWHREHKDETLAGAPAHTDDMSASFTEPKHPRSGNGQFTTKPQPEQGEALSATIGRGVLRDELIGAGHSPMWVDAALKQVKVGEQGSPEQVETVGKLLAGELVVCIKCRTTIPSAEADEGTGYCPDCLNTWYGGRTFA